MAQYLSPEWFTEMEQAAGAFVPEVNGDEPVRPVRLKEVITDTPFGEVSYMVSIEAGQLQILRHSEEAPDVTFNQDYATAAALHRSELTTQEAFFAGKVRVSGHLNKLLDNSAVLQGLAPVFADVRANTSY